MLWAIEHLGRWRAETMAAYSSLLAVIALPLLAELLFPRNAPDIKVKARGAIFLAVYVPLGTALAIGTAALLTDGRSRLLQPITWAACPVWVRVVLFALAYDLFYYWGHRLQHRFLWRGHAMHHSIADLGASNSYHHVSAAVIDGVTIMAPLYFLGIAEGALIATLLRVQGYFLHSATRLNLGPLRWVINDNRNHRIHHSLEERHWHKNFAVVSPLWDIVFGTAHMSEPEAWPDTGLPDRSPPTSIVDYITQPFRD